ncbi:hypothetical protein [Amphritea sp.]|uniref:hypothetical protein n=1 Tax=Amphritea sp. TaxID=1872502 RepID=UPI003A93C064
MKQLINTYLNGTLGQIIYAGVGKASTLECLLALDFKSLKLIEPIATTAKRREKRYGGEKVEVMHAALSSVTGNDDFTVMQPEKYSSLKQEINLRHILKNSQVKAVEPIKTIGLSDLIEEAKLSKDENNVLILNVNGLERECIENTPIESITQFSTLIVQIETQGIYTQDSHIDRQLKALLKPLGFYFEDIKPENTIFANLVFKRDDAALAQIANLHQVVSANQELKNQLEQIGAERESLANRFNTREQELEESKTKLTQQQEDADKQKAELSAQVAEAGAKAKQLEAQLAERTQQRDEQNKHHQEHKKRAESFKSQLEQVSAERESFTARLESSQQALEESQNRLIEQEDEADKLIKQSNVENSSLLKRLAALVTDKSELEKELLEVKRSASLGQKMLAKSQIDLDNLRDSYNKKANSEKDLVELVRELKEKLTLASKYYYQLQKEHPELLSSVSNTEER